MPNLTSLKTIMMLFLLLSFTFSQLIAALQDRIIFLHIPKSGGVSVSSILMNEYPYEETFGTNIQNVKLHSYGFHLSLFETKKMIDTSTFKLITFIRNPLDRVLSEHYYCMGKHHGNPVILKAHRLPARGDPLQTASNITCKMLSGLNDNDPDISMQTHLIHAKKNLTEKFFFVGITERMEESIHLLYSRLGWNNSPEIPHFNETPFKEQFSEDLLQGIKERNWADLELYEYAMILFEEQKIADQNTSQNQQPDDLPVFHYTFDQILRGSGWGPRESSTEINKVYRWATDANLAEVNFKLPPGSNYAVECQIFIQPILFHQLTLSINGNPVGILPQVPLNTGSTQYQWVPCKGTFTQGILNHEQITKVAFKMVSPEDPFLASFYANDFQQCNIMNNYNRGKFACQEIYFTIY